MILLFLRDVLFMKQSFCVSLGNSLWNISWKWQNVRHTHPENNSTYNALHNKVPSTTNLLSDNPTHHWILKVLKFKSLELKILAWKMLFNKTLLTIFIFWTKIVQNTEGHIASQYYISRDLTFRCCPHLFPMLCK